ncbi:hypothetical protein B7P33_04015 [Sediminicola luteus]|uniref:Uncharacterized protein n=1 Tax=Sediminicola luteus TaxID=319238 RepID=A0A2A4GBY7_9FLAO|nr:hypothetical protein B7P33_04015 [Sediminicola luteus]
MIILRFLNNLSTIFDSQFRADTNFTNWHEKWDSFTEVLLGQFNKELGVKGYDAKTSHFVIPKSYFPPPFSNLQITQLSNCFIASLLNWYIASGGH